MDYSSTAKELIKKLGGKENIVSLNYCMTRLRFTLKNQEFIDDTEISSIPGVLGIIRRKEQYQVIIGTKVLSCFHEIKSQIDTDQELLPIEPSLKYKEKLLLASDSPLTIYNPIEGIAIPLTQVHDATFSSQVLGKGYAVIPSIGKVVAPFCGTLKEIIDFYHTLLLVSNDGMTILIHIGLNTLQLQGKYFSPKIKPGDTFLTGDTLLEFDLDSIKHAGYNLTTPVILTNVNSYSNVTITDSGFQKFGTKMMSIFT